MFEFETLWDLYEFKIFLLLVTGAIAIYLGNRFIEAREKEKGLRKQEENDN